MMTLLGMYVTCRSPALALYLDADRQRSNVARICCQCCFKVSQGRLRRGRRHDVIGSCRCCSTGFGAHLHFEIFCSVPHQHYRCTGKQLQARKGRTASHVTGVCERAACQVSDSHVSRRLAVQPGMAASHHNAGHCGSAQDCPGNYTPQLTRPHASMLTSWLPI